MRATWIMEPRSWGHFSRTTQSTNTIGVASRSGSTDGVKCSQLGWHAHRLIKRRAREQLRTDKLRFAILAIVCLVCVYRCQGQEPYLFQLLCSQNGDDQGTICTVECNARLMTRFYHSFPEFHLHPLVVGLAVVAMLSTHGKALLTSCPSNSQASLLSDSKASHCLCPTRAPFCDGSLCTTGHTSNGVLVHGFPLECVDCVCSVSILCRKPRRLFTQ